MPRRRRAAGAAHRRRAPGRSRPRPVMATSGRPNRPACLTRSASSAVSPLFESARMASPGTTIPRSPWLASPGCTNRAGVPVEARVAAILRATRPDLPMPVRTTRPVQATSRSTASSNAASSEAASARSPAASAASTPRATSIAEAGCRASAAVITLLLCAACEFGSTTAALRTVTGIRAPRGKPTWRGRNRSACRVGVHGEAGSASPTPNPSLEGRGSPACVRGRLRLRVWRRPMIARLATRPTIARLATTYDCASGDNL